MSETESIALAPIIDADAQELKRLKKERLDLLCEWRRVVTEWDDGKKKALEPLEVQMDQISRKIKALGPKPECFGTNLYGYRAQCDECDIHASCFRMMKAKEES